MSSQVRILLLVVTVGAVAMIVRWVGSSSATSRMPVGDKQATADSVARYATDEFVAACCVRPKELIKHAYFGSLPIDRFLPAPLSLGRLDSMDVEELAVFCGPGRASKPDDGRVADIEWAAAARTSHPIELEAVATQWRHSIVPQEEDPRAKPVVVDIENYRCFQVPAGTFLMPSRTYGELRFTDRQGQAAERGINVGRIYEYRSYIEGDSQSSAIFTLDHIDEADLVDGHLPLEVRLDVFPTRMLDQEYSLAQIELRNPDSGLRSEPMTFAAKSYVNHRLNVPRLVTAMDAQSKRQVDLLNDLVSNGRLEVVLTSNESGVYLGVGRNDINVRPRAFEYVFVSGRELIVAQSRRTLEKMLSAAAAPVALAERLSLPTADMVMTANVRDESQRIAFRRLLRAIGDKTSTAFWGDALIDMTATVNVQGRTAARVIAEFEDRRNASRAKSQLQQLIRSAKARAHEDLGNALNRLDALSSLLSLGFDSISMSFPDQASPLAPARESQLLSMIDDSLDQIQVETEGKLLTVDVPQPASFAGLPEAAKYAVANIEEVQARDLFEREKFDLGNEMYGRVTDRFPHVPQTWYRRAHQLAYNMSVQFDGYENRYAWVRRGVNVLLDGAEQNPGTTDLTWMAARLIGRKIGESDDRMAYRQLFSQDERLHRRIARIIDLEGTRSAERGVDNWLVAKLMFEDCVDRHANSGASSTISPLLFFSQPAATQARYAQALSDAGRWKEALRAWKEAEQLHNELGERTILLATSNRIRLNDLESRLAKYGPDDASVKQLHKARRRIQYDYWLARCSIEQTTELQSARRMSREAAEYARRAETRKAYEAYANSLQSLTEALKQRPHQMSLVAGEFQQVAAGYRKAAELIGDTDSLVLLKLKEHPLASILNLIDNSQPVANFSLIDLENDDEADAAR